jgi:serine/threonine protein phosphatase 1
MSAPTLPPNLRVYAIGDIHGRLDLLERLLAQIDEDARTAPHPTLKIFLGDYIDRGVQSRQVLDRLIALKATETPAPVLLLGNHEHVLRELLRAHDINLLQDWLRFGGRETLMSYGIRPQMLADPRKLDGVREEFVANFPPSHTELLTNMGLSVDLGDYFFCHAGVRPGVPLAQQSEDDLMWIRQDFLQHTESFGKVIVHGHTICPAAEFTPHRINVDTGAYATGCLTALALEGTQQWLIQTK